MQHKYHVHYRNGDLLNDPPVPSLFVTDMSEYGYIHVGEIQIDIPFDPPSQAELIKSRVAELRKEQGELQAKMTSIEGCIQELLCIEHKED